MKLTRIMIFLLLITSLLPLSPVAGMAGPFQAQSNQLGDPETPLAGEGVTVNPRLYLPIINNSNRSGILSDSLYGVEAHDLDSGGKVEMMTDAGAYWIRRNGILWNEAEPSEGNIAWNSSTIKDMESELGSEDRAGIEPIMIVRNTPSWAQKYSGSICGPIKADKMDEFGEFMYQIVKHFSAEPYNVKYWELGNEPDVSVHYNSDWPFGCWGDWDDAYFGGGYYAEMLKQAYPRIKAADPDAQVLVGGLLLDCDPNNPPSGKNCTPSKFLEGILRNNGGPYFDGVSFHAYEYYSGSYGTYSNPNWSAAWNTTGPVLNRKTDFLRSVLASYGYSGKYLILSELALLCDSGCDSNFEETKANYLAQAYADSHLKGLKSSIWYDLNGGWKNSELFSAGVALPAYYAFDFSHQELFGADSVLNKSDGWFKALEFQFGDHRVWVVWSKDGVGRNYTLPGKPYRIYDRYGNTKTSSNTIYVDRNVLYLEWAP